MSEANSITSAPVVEKRGENSYRVTIYGGTDSRGNPILHRKTFRLESMGTRKRSAELQEAIRAYRAELEERYKDGSVFSETVKNKKAPVPKVEKRGENSYRITIVYGRDQNGKLCTHRRTVHINETQPRKIQDALNDEVYKFTKDLEEAWKNGAPCELSIDIVLRDFIEKEWLPYCKMSEQLSERAVEDYERIANARIIPVLGNKKLGDVKPQDIERIYFGMRQEGLAGTTCKRVHEVLRSIFSRAIQLGLLVPERNPLSRVKPPKRDDEYKFQVFTEDQAKRFLQALYMEYPRTCPVRIRKKKDGTEYPVKAYVYQKPNKVGTMFQAFFTLALYSGCRRAELCALNWEDIDFEKKTLKISKALTRTNANGHYLKSPKTKAGNRILTLPDECLTELRRWKEEAYQYAKSLGTAWCGESLARFEQSPVFIKTELNPGSRIALDIPAKKLRDIINMYNGQCEREEDKLPQIRFHDLRHTHASILLANNVDIATVAHRLGHEKITTTLEIYTHYMPLKDVEAANLIGNLFT